MESTPETFEKIEKGCFFKFEIKISELWNVFEWIVEYIFIEKCQISEKELWWLVKFLLVMFLFSKFTQKTSDNCSKVELAKIIKIMGNEIWKTNILSQSLR